MRGRVVSHDVEKKGWWIFKREKPVLRIQLNLEDRKMILRRCRRVRGTNESYFRLPKNITLKEITHEEQRNCSIGEDVEMVVGYLPPAYQGTEYPLAVIELRSSGFRSSVA